MTSKDVLDDLRSEICSLLLSSLPNLHIHNIVEDLLSTTTTITVAAAATISTTTTTTTPPLVIAEPSHPCQHFFSFLSGTERKMKNENLGKKINSHVSVICGSS